MIISVILFFPAHISSFLTHLLYFPIFISSSLLDLCLPPFLMLRCTFLLQSDVREAYLWDRQLVAPSLPGQSVRVLPDTRACVFCNGVHSRRWPDDAHPHRRLQRATSRVRNVCVGECVSVCVCVHARVCFRMRNRGMKLNHQHLVLWVCKYTFTQMSPDRRKWKLQSLLGHF